MIVFGGCHEFACSSAPLIGVPQNDTWVLERLASDRPAVIVFFDWASTGYAREEAVRIRLETFAGGSANDAAGVDVLLWDAFAGAWSVRGGHDAATPAPATVSEDAHLWLDGAGQLAVAIATRGSGNDARLDADYVELVIDFDRN
jgi:hypothetical protein